jgi:hypothetical protein
MSKKNIFTIILIFGSIVDHDNLVASDKQDCIFNDFTTNLANLSYTDISIIAVAAGISMYAGYYARQNLNNKPDIHEEISEGSECLFTFHKHAFGKLSEDGSQDYRSDEESTQESLNLYNLIEDMNFQGRDDLKANRIISLEDIKNMQKNKSIK